MPGRTLAIGDVHGCSKALAALLDLIGPRPEDTIVTLGDYINRGPDSRGVLDRLVALSRECRLIPILGNHDQTLLDARSGKQSMDALFDMKGTTTLDSYGPGRSLDLIPGAHWRFLEGCLPYHETDRHLFTHANYEYDRPMSEQADETIRWLSLREVIPPPHESGKVAILGHTAQKSGKVLDLGHLVCIDTYCHGGGRLTALDVYSGKVRQVDRDGRPRR